MCLLMYRQLRWRSGADCQVPPRLQCARFRPEHQLPLCEGQRRLQGALVLIPPVLMQLDVLAAQPLCRHQQEAAICRARLTERELRLSAALVLPCVLAIIPTDQAARRSACLQPVYQHGRDQRQITLAAAAPATTSQQAVPARGARVHAHIGTQPPLILTPLLLCLLHSMASQV